MKDLKELLEQINKSPKVIAHLDVITETDTFSQDRMREIITGLKNEQLMDAFITLCVITWKSLVTRTDKRVYVDNMKSSRILKFAVRDKNGDQESQYDGNIEQFLNSVKVNELEARKQDEEILVEKKKILEKMVMLENDGKKKYLNPSEEEKRALFNWIDEIQLYRDKQCWDSFESLQKEGTREEIIGQLSHVMTLYSAELYMTKELIKEKQLLSIELSSVKAELDILNSEHQHLSQTQQERDEAIKRAEEISKALEETKKQLGDQSVTLQSLVNKIQDTPYLSLREKCFEVLDYLLHDNKHWDKFSKDIINRETINQEKSSINIEKLYGPGACHADFSLNISTESSDE